jgi:hypothetical protein
MTPKEEGVEHFYFKLKKSIHILVFPVFGGKT